MFDLTGGSASVAETDRTVRPRPKVSTIDVEYDDCMKTGAN